MPAGPPEAEMLLIRAENDRGEAQIGGEVSGPRIVSDQIGRLIEEGREIGQCGKKGAIPLLPFFGRGNADWVPSLLVEPLS